jgi:hypothetical protein
MTQQEEMILLQQQGRVIELDHSLVVLQNNKWKNIDIIYLNTDF